MKTRFGVAAALFFLSSVAQAQIAVPLGPNGGAGGGGGGSGSGTVTSVSSGCGTSTGGAPITISGSVAAAITKRTNTTTSDPIVSTDCGNVVQENNASAIAVGIAQAGTTGFANGAFFEACNIGAGTATITPTTSTIGGAASYALAGGTAAAPLCVAFQSDGTNYNLIQVPGSGGTTITIASGTAALGTGAISSATCATVVTATATGVAATDTLLASFNGDPTAVTGYIPLTAGMLTIIAYPTSASANFKVCNNTSASITPGAITLNWRVVR